MFRRGVSSLVALLLCTTPLHAQTGTLADKVQALFRFGDCGLPICLSLVTGPHGYHFLPAAITGNVALLSGLTQSIGVVTSSFPLGSTSGGATFKFVGGLPVKTSESDGPIFAERGQTLGKGRFLMGMNLSGVKFTSFRGVPLNNMPFTFTHQDIGQPGLGDVTFENDVINVRMSLNVTLLQSSFFVNYGLFNGLDLSIALPVIYAHMEGSSTADIMPFGTPAFHYFAGGPDDSTKILRASAAEFGSSTGVGDLATRIKIGLTNTDRFQMALLLDGRWATGNPDNFQGSGKTAIRSVLIASAKFGTFSPHLNVGYYWINKDSVLSPYQDTLSVQIAGSKIVSAARDQILATAGFDQLLNPWTTLAVDVISQWQVGASTIKIPGRVDYVLPYKRSVYPTIIPDQKDNRIDAALGFKFKLSPGATLVTNAMVPMLKGGVEPSFVWTTGAEFNF